MSPKIKERFEITGWTVAIGLLSIVAYFVIRINDKIDYSYKANVEQQEINKNVKEKLEDLETAYIIVDSRSRKISSRLITIETILKTKPGYNENDQDQNQDQ